MGAGAETIKDLHDGYEGEDVGDGFDYIGVVGEQDGEVES